MFYAAVTRSRNTRRRPRNFHETATSHSIFQEFPQVALKGGITLNGECLRT